MLPADGVAACFFLSFGVPNALAQSSASNSPDPTPSSAWLFLAFATCAVTTLAALLALLLGSRRARETRQRAAKLQQEVQRLRSDLDDFGRRWSALIDAEIGLVIAALDRRIVHANGSFGRMLGYPAEALVGRDLLDLTHPVDRPGCARSFAAIDADPAGRITIEQRCLHRDGSTVRCLANAAVVRDENRRPLYLIAQIEDITERRRASEQLKRNEERLRAIVETIEEVFWTAEPGGVQATYVSPAVWKIWGYPQDRFLQNPSLVLETIHPDDRAIFLDAVAQQAKGLRTSIEYRVFHADGSIRWIWDQGFPVFDAAGKLISVNGLATNITERRMLEAQLRQAQKMEAIGTLAGGIAHDFNNILGSIIGFAELARIDAHGNDAVEQGLRDVLRASRRAKSLVQQILTFSRQQEAHRQPVQFDAVAQEAVQALRATAPEGVHIEFHAAPELPPVVADSTQLHQIVMNLGTNALHAIRPCRGHITFRLDIATITAEFSQAHPGLAPGPHVRLRVTDSGAGIAPESMDHIFEPFFTTKAPGEGSGLGLSVVHGIVTSHRGAVTIDSALESGTTVQVVLPAIELVEQWKTVEAAAPTREYTALPSL